jgi:competence protein ComEA
MTGYPATTLADNPGSDKMLRKLLIVLIGWLIAASTAWAAVDVNTADQATLESLKGIGPVKSKAIIDERTRNGPFKDAADLAKRVKGLGTKSVATLQSEGLVIGGSAGSAAAKNAPATKASTPSTVPSTSSTTPSASTAPMTKPSPRVASGAATAGAAANTKSTATVAVDTTTASDTSAKKPKKSGKKAKSAEAASASAAAAASDTGSKSSKSKKQKNSKAVAASQPAVR